MVCPSRPPKFDHRPLFNPRVLWFAAILNHLKNVFLQDQNNFYYKLNSNTTDFTFMEKYSENIFFFFVF